MAFKYFGISAIEFKTLSALLDNIFLSTGPVRTPIVCMPILFPEMMLSSLFFFIGFGRIFSEIKNY